MSPMCKLCMNSTRSVLADDQSALASAARGMPAVVVAEQARPRLSIGHAMGVVGSLVKQLVQYDASSSAGKDGEEVAATCDQAAPAAPCAPPRFRPRHVQHVVLVAAGPKAADTLERAVCSIAFKSHLALVSDRNANE